jgi:hypothetical protein
MVVVVVVNDDNDVNEDCGVGATIGCWIMVRYRTRANDDT